MKTTKQTLYKIFGTILIATTILILNPVQADTAINTYAGNKREPHVATSAMAGNEVSSTTSQSTDKMLEDPNYWVNYLKSTVNTNEEDDTNKTSVIDEMQNNPEYWIDSLKHIVTEE